jgi:hypothetical protein
MCERYFIKAWERTRFFLQKGVSMTVSETQTPFDDIAVTQPRESGGKRNARRRLAVTRHPIGEIAATRKPQQTFEDDDNDPIPRELDEFRRELTRRLQKLMDAE